MSTTDNRFNQIMPFVFKWEGGFSDDKDDRGGATNLGIIQTEYNQYRKSKGKPTQSVRYIAMTEAVDIYDTKYWNNSPSRLCPQPLDMVVLDTAINMGVGAATRLLQTALNVTSDGVFGPASRQAIADHCYDAASTMHIVDKYVGLREQRYRRIAQNGNQSKFLKGWLNRLRDLSKQVGLAVAFDVVVSDGPELMAKAYSAYGEQVFEPVDEEGIEVFQAEDNQSETIIGNVTAQAMSAINELQGIPGLLNLGLHKRKSDTLSIQSEPVAEQPVVFAGLSVDYDNVELDDIESEDVEDAKESDDNQLSALGAFRVQGFVCHLTASKWGDAAAVREWHRDRGWSDIGYHALILNGYRTSKLTYELACDGKIEPGRSETIAGAHCLANGMNRCTLGVSCVGNPAFVVKQSKLGTSLAANSRVAYLTERQEDALIHWLAVNCKQYGVDPQGTFKHPVSGKMTPTISQHSQWDANKPTCASLNMERVRSKVKAVMQALS